MKEKEIPPAAQIGFPPLQMFVRTWFLVQVRILQSRVKTIVSFFVFTVLRIIDKIAKIRTEKILRFVIIEIHRL